MASSNGKLSAFVILLIAVVVVGGIGSYFAFYPQTGPTTRTTSVMSSLQTTSKPLVTYLVFGKIFFDYNGNGKQDLGESDVPDVVVALNGKNVTATNGTGWYVINNLPSGVHTVKPYPPTNFRYMAESNAEYRSVKANYLISVRNDTRKDIGLMEGFLTLPFAKGTRHTIDWYFDISNDSRPIDWQGGSQTGNAPKPLKHGGIDYGLAEMIPIIAAAPGTVSVLGFSSYGGLTVLVNHYDGFITAYVHLKEIKVEKGQILKRGDMVGYSGAQTVLKYYPHLHFEVERRSSDTGTRYPVDPYRSLVPPLGSPLSLWTKDNDPQYFV